MDILINPLKNNIHECTKNEWTCVKVVFFDKVNYGVDDFVMFLNRARYNVNQKIYNVPLFSKIAQITMKVFDLWLNFGAIDPFNWKIIINSLNSCERISRKLLSCRTILTDVFNILKIRFQESCEKKLFSFQLFKFNLKIHGLRNCKFFSFNLQVIFIFFYFKIPLGDFIMFEMFDLVQLAVDDVCNFFKELQEEQENQILNKLFDLNYLQITDASEEVIENMLANIIFDILALVKNC